MEEYAYARWASMNSLIENVQAILADDDEGTTTLTEHERGEYEAALANHIEQLEEFKLLYFQKH